MFEFPQPAFRPRRPELRCPLAGTPPIRPRQPCRFRVLAFTLAAFFTLHTGYGIGYWAGLCDFAVLHRQPAASATRLSR